MAFVIHGIGVMTYGEREYWPDGSFVTTEWFVLGWIPIIPLGSKRIAYTRNSDYATYDASGGYWVFETMGVNRKQALFVYLWFVSILGPIVVWGTFQNPLAKLFRDEDRAAAAVLALTATAFVFPYFLRRWAKRRKIHEWKRQNLGLHG